MKRQALKGLRVTSRSSSSRKEKGPRRPPCSSHSHMPAPAPARMGVPDPPGSPDKSKKRGRKPKTLAAEGTRLGDQRRTMAAAAASGEGASCPANQGGGSAELGGGAGAMATGVDPGARLTFQNSFGLFRGRDLNQDFQTPEGSGIQERSHGCTRRKGS